MVAMKPPDGVTVVVATIRSDPFSWMLRLHAEMVASKGTVVVVAAALVAGVARAPES
jgi:hypothetical protein